MDTKVDTRFKKCSIYAVFSVFITGSNPVSRSFGEMLILQRFPDFLLILCGFQGKKRSRFWTVRSRF